MAYTKEKQANEWVELKEFPHISVVGDEKRFSISVMFEEHKVQVNGCRAQKGKDGYFISFPSWVDKKDNWHNYCYISFSGKESDAILRTILG